LTTHFVRWAATPFWLLLQHIRDWDKLSRNDAAVAL
jgi:hypothetical protein